MSRFSLIYKRQGKRMFVTMETTVNKPCVIATLLSQKGLKPSVFTLELSIEFASFYPLVY